MPRLRLVLPAALLLPLVSCGAQEPSDELLDALRTVCGDAAKVSPGDPGDDEPPEYSTREDDWVVVWDEGGVPGALDPLADAGFEVVDGAAT